ncbi:MULTISPECIES: glutathione S-transferase family protein [unclassified Devosia]|uniref:glutathione S-transferase family protein n=1 Tax=unclassified Devosia TaxID=196773 RepID=UPI000FDCC3A2|nr:MULTISPECIES: glutathione S-transferase family protein [unclassified Devosia]
MKLHFSRNPNPRLAVAVAKYLGADIEFHFAAPRDPSRAGDYLHLNPNLLLPILEVSPRPIWETDAVACFLSRQVGSQFWRTDADEPEMIRWISWGKDNFVKACDTVHWERGTKLRYGLGPYDAAAVAEGLERFHTAAQLLEAELADRTWLVGDAVSYADFRMGTFLPFNDIARLPIKDYPAVSRWYRRMEAIEAWRDPFAGTTAPELPPVPS